MSDNPYASPSATSASLGIPEVLSNDELAGRLTRFAAAFVDGISVGAIIMSVSFATGYFQRIQTQTAGIVEQLAMALLGLITFLALHGYLLLTRGQTIGKLLTGIQIVDVNNGNLLPFVRAYVYRYLWLTPAVILVAFIPGSADDLLINLVALIDALMIFGGERRCLHDYVAGSKVVLYREGRAQNA